MTLPEHATAVGDQEDFGHLGSLLVNAAFLSHARHELRTPLNAIIGYSEILIEDAEPLGRPDICADLGKIHAAGKTLLIRVNESFDSSVIGAHESTVDLTAFLASVCHDLRSPLNTVIGYSELLLEETNDGACSPLREDLERILNAGKKLLKLVDDLIGITALNLAAADSATTEIETTFTDRLAVVRSGDDRSPRTAREPITGLVLVVDDNETNRDLLSRRLSRQGYSVDAVESGRIALERMRAVPFDAVLLDVLMPEMDGFRVLEHMKEDPVLRHIPVVMISALDEIDSVVRCIEAGAEDYLAKPFNPVLLNARVSACLEKKRLRDREMDYLRQIEEEKNRSNELLHVILPHEIVQELTETNRVVPRRFEEVAVLFCDVVDFTPYCTTHSAEEVIAHLQELIESYEEIIGRHGMQKIKTIGDSTMATAGLLKPAVNPALCAVRCGIEMVAVSQTLGAGWSVRVGIHLGPVVAGVVGRKQYLYDLWGDTVNTAARVESHGVDGAVNVSRYAWEKVSSACRGVSLGPVELKGKGSLEVFRVDGFVEEVALAGAIR